jgi:hypothetical protein
VIAEIRTTCLFFFAGSIQIASASAGKLARFLVSFQPLHIRHCFSAMGEVAASDVASV